MKLISRIKISKFRSIKDIDLRNIGDFTVFAGLNNSGKSNVLRALNLFFSDYTDEHESEIDFNNDFYRPEAGKHRKKEISISITFSIPDNFSFRKDLEHVKRLINGPLVTISKKWDRFDTYPYYFLNDNRNHLDGPDIQKIDQFLSLISFRYIPNRVLPIDLIKNEHSALRDALIRRFGKKDPSQTNVFNAIKDSSLKLISKMSKDFKKSFPTAEEVLLKTPDSWAEMIFALGYRIVEDHFEFDDTLQGSGIQSLLMFNTLALIDRDYFQQFGWRQAAIWAIEEPESSLHSTLEAQISSYLAEIAKETKSRLQVFATTHSDLMMQYADSVGLFNKERGATQATLYHDKKEILQISASLGISRWVDPILQYPLEPLILVEGKFDHDFLNQALKITRPDLPIRTTYLRQLEGEDISGGIDELLKYIHTHRNAIKARHKSAPLIILIDWDSKNKKGQFEKYFEQIDPYKVLVWDESKCNPKLDRSIRGIERFFSDRIILEAEEIGAPISWTRRGIAKVSSHDYGEVKRKCNEIVQKGIRYEDLKYCKELLDELIKIIR